MPDSQLPPLWGPAYDERDLDALLSGETGSTPAVLRPVESTLAALRGAGRELSHEAAARAAFRAFAPARYRRPDGAAAARGGGWAAAAAPAVTAHTLVLPPADDRPAPRRGAGTGTAARPPGGARKPGIAVTGAAAAALIVVAVGGHRRPDRLDRRAHVVLRAAARQRQRVRPRDRGTSPGSQGPLATGAARDADSRARSRRPRPRTPALHPTSGPGSLCREYFEYLEHPLPGGAAAWVALRGQLSKLAGGAVVQDLRVLPSVPGQPARGQGRRGRRSEPTPVAAGRGAAGVTRAPGRPSGGRPSAPGRPRSGRRPAAVGGP